MDDTDLQRLDNKKGFEMFVEEVVSRGARGNLEDRGNLVPVILFIARRHPKTGEVYDPPQMLPMAVPGDWNDPNVKDEVAEVARRIAEDVNAMASIMVTEAWTTHKPADAALEKRIRDLGGVGNLPDSEKREVVLLAVEHELFGYRMYSGDIIRAVEGLKLDKPTVGPITAFGDWMPTLDSRFTALLPAHNKPVTVH